MVYVKVENNQVVKVNSRLESFSAAAPAWNAAQRAANGIYEVVYDNSNLKDPRFYINGAESFAFANDQVTASYATATGKTLGDVNAVDADDEPVLDEDGNVVTEAVMGTREAPKYQGIDQSKLVPPLVKTIQELEARITALEA